MLLPLLACQTPSLHQPPLAPPPPTTPPSVSVPNTDPVTVPIADQDLAVTVEAPWSLARAPIAVGDLDGDGAVDLLLGLDQPSALLWVVVRGPLSGVSVPSGAWVTWDGAFYTPRIAEVSGDGQADLMVEYNPSGAIGSVPPVDYAVIGPWDGDPGPTASWIPVDPELWRNAWVDVDGDGTLDVVRDPDLYDPGAGQIAITWGPLGRWAGGPDVVVTPLCAAGSGYGYPWSAVVQPEFPGDLDGDGRPELTIGGYGLYDHVDCGDFTLSLPDRGAVDPAAAGVAGVDPGAVAIGDWDGDGLPEVWDPRQGLLQSPITSTAAGLVGSLAAVDPAVQRLVPLGFGGSAVLAYLEGDRVAVVSGDLGALAAISGGWERASAEDAAAYQEDGVGYLLLLDPSGSVVRRVAIP